MPRAWSIANDIFWVIFAVGLVGGGIFGFRMLGEMKEHVVAAPIERTVPLVTVEALTPYQAALPIRGDGFISAYRQVALAPEVAGRIIDLHPAIDNRGPFRTGEVLVRLDDRTARADLARADSDVGSTVAKLDLNETQLARSETLLKRGVVSQDRVDQLRSQNAELKAVLESLRAARQSAEIALAKTTVVALFDGAVLDQSAELAAVVSAGQEIAKLFTDRQLEVTIPVSERDASLIPGLFGDGRAKAMVTTRFANRDVAWNAEVIRVEPALDNRTRTVGVTLALKGRVPIETGAARASLPAGTPPALLNAFVRATIDGARLDGLHALPSTSIRQGDQVWLAEEDRLSIRPVRIVHVDGETTFVTFEDDPGAAGLVTSVLDAPIDGMEIQIVDQSSRTADLKD